jgi:hypothetical protein
MHLQATFTLADLTEALTSFTPLEIRLGDLDNQERTLSIDRPLEVTLVAGRGLRIGTTARFTWTLAGLEVPVTVKAASLLLLPEIVTLEGREALRFLLVLESADLKLLPSFVDEKFVERVNEALTAEEARPTWKFLDTLTFSVGLPERLRSARALTLTAQWGAVQVTEAALNFTVSYEAAVTKTEAPAAAGAP